jgi:hypothetical protein
MENRSSLLRLEKKSLSTRFRCVCQGGRYFDRHSGNADICRGRVIAEYHVSYETSLRRVKPGIVRAVSWPWLAPDRRGLSIAPGEVQLDCMSARKREPNRYDAPSEGAWIVRANPRCWRIVNDTCAKGLHRHRRCKAA